MPASLPNPDEIGKAATAFLLSRDGWTSRHVEHFDVIDEVFARRHLTVDIRLPRTGGRVAKAEGKGIYVAPVAVMRKDRPVTGIDLRDESGTALPLLTRGENASLSAAAICATARRMARWPLGQELRDRFGAIARGEPAVAAEAYAAPPRSGRARHVMGRLTAHPLAARFDRFVARMVQNSVVWVSLAGHPGDRRIVKLGYEYPVGDPRRSLGNRLALVFGIAPLDLWFFTPYLPESGSYHLQISTPPGLQMRELNLVGNLIRRPGAEPYLYLERSVRGGHLYLTGLRAEGDSAVTFELRIGRRGYLLAALVASTMIAALLAIFAACPAGLSAQPEAGVPVLLIVPALLVVLAARREHALVTVLLGGVRMLVLLSGSAAVLAALNLAGFRPGLSLRHWWEVDAVAAAVVAVVVLVIWLLAGRSVRRHVQTWSAVGPDSSPGP